MLLSMGTIIVIDKDLTMESDKYKSKVIDMGEGFIMIDYPTHIETGKTAFFMDGAKLHVTFTDSLKTSYVFETEVSGRLKQGVSMLKLTYPGDDQLIKIQRREFVRVGTAIDVALLKNGQFTQLVAEDLSAGGAAINLSEGTVFNEDDSVSVVFALPYMNKEIKYVKLGAEVIRIWEKDSRKIASLKFDKIGTFERQAIIRFCFERQLKIRDSVKDV
ncbi:flagellar brake domain-containing protein [Filibacter tadaridae]|uniref:Flagellar protein YcgR n=1 Tax=Filibacter tadaridae TaxID=2483811 RepID=A0A3P5XD64_9BACL|nr:flagellar brake domain-containing protein [Filibacter tadaridae]VDC29275.1 Flagellar protein YcgR [Filibacter tadaridae]